VISGKKGGFLDSFTFGNPISKGSNATIHLNSNKTLIKRKLYKDETGHQPEWGKDSDSMSNLLSNEGYSPKLHKSTVDPKNPFDMEGYKIYDYVNGKDLSKIKAPLPLKRQKELLDSVLLLHKNGYVHGDIKKENVIVPDDTNKKIQLIDFDEGFGGNKPGSQVFINDLNKLSELIDFKNFPQLYKIFSKYRAVIKGEVRGKQLQFESMIFGKLYEKFLERLETQ